MAGFRALGAGPTGQGIHSMHPAVSVILFTTLSGAGYGLLLWLGVSIAALQFRATPIAPMQSTYAWALALGLLLSTLGLASSFAHLGKPLRAWRAFSQWRTSWLSREGVLAVATTVPALATGALLLGGAHGTALALSAALLAALSLATVGCTAMIYASLPPIPAWRHALVLPVYVLFAVLTGMALLFLVLSARLPLGKDGPGMLALVSAVALALVVAKWTYWRAIDRLALPVSRGAAVGLPDRDVTVFERPHTEANFVTREMAFAIARAHSRRLRLLATLLLLGMPLLAYTLSTLGIGPRWAPMALAAAGTLTGAFVERWLFFAEARHVVTRYY